MAKKNKFFNAAIATSLVATALVGAAAQVEASQTFSDVKNSDYFYNDVVNLTERGVIKGFEDGSFRPNEFVTRGQAAKIIAGALGLDTTAVANPNFKDIPTTHSYYGAIAALANAGIINGFEDGTFRSGEPVQRNHMAKIIAGAFGLEASAGTSPFTDVRADYAKYINALYEAGVTTGKTATTFDGASNVKRGQLAAFVVRAEGVAKTAATTFTVSSVAGNKVQTSAGELVVDVALQTVFNAANSEALTGAEVTATVVNGTVKSISALTLKAAGTAEKAVVFDAKAVIAGDVKVNADFVTVKNITAENIIVAQQAKTSVTIEGVTVKNQIVVENSSDAVASLVATTPVAFKLQLTDTTSNVVVNRDLVTIASNKKLGTVSVGSTVKSVTVQADAAKFVAAHTVTVLGKGIIDVVEIAKNAQLDYQVEGTIKQLIIADATAKLKLTAKANIEKLVIPDGTTLAAVIQNYNAIKSKIGEVTTASGKAVAKASGGGGGGSSSNKTDDKQEETKPEEKPEQPEEKPEVKPEEPEYIETEIVTAGTILTKPGTYGPKNGEKLVVAGNLVIDSEDVTLQNVVVTGNLVLGAGIGEGDVNLEGVEVQGTTKVNGGGENSIYFTDSVLATVIVNKNTGAVRIVAQGTTEVVEVLLESAATVEEQGLAEGFEGFEDVTLTEAMERNSNLAVSLVGSFESINSRVANVRINLPETTTIRELVLQVAATVTGSGTIQTAYINNSGSSLEQRPQNVVLNTGYVQIGNETITESYDNAVEATLNGITATQNAIALDLSAFVSNVTSADLAIVAFVDGEEYELQNLRYVSSLSRYEFDPIPLTGNIGKTVTIVASPDTGRITGAPVEATYEISYGFAGRITDIHGAGAENATLTIRPVRLETSGDSVVVTTTDASSVTTTTDRFGYYSVNVPTAGEYEVEIAGRNYLTTSFRAFAMSDWFSTTENENAMRAAGADEVKIVLTWGEKPHDLDSHLTGPSGNGGNFHVYFGDKVDSNGNTTFVDLDWDDTNSYGPETTTIRKLLDGTYRFHVHNWSGETELHASDAKVEVYKGNSNQPDFVFDIPTTETYADNWLVFDLKVSNGGETIEILPINIFTDFNYNIDFITSNSYDGYIAAGNEIRLDTGEGVEIRYAINAEPTLESPLYTGPITLSESATINTISILNGVVMASESRHFNVLTLEEVELEVAEYEADVTNQDIVTNLQTYSELKGKLHVFDDSEARNQLLNKISEVSMTAYQQNFEHLEDVEQQLTELITVKQYVQAKTLVDENQAYFERLYPVDGGAELATRLQSLVNTLSSVEFMVFDSEMLTITSTAVTTADMAVIESISLTSLELDVNASPIEKENGLMVYLGDVSSMLPTQRGQLSTVTIRYKDSSDEQHILVLEDVMFYPGTN